MAAAERAFQPAEIDLYLPEILVMQRQALRQNVYAVREQLYFEFGSLHTHRYNFPADARSARLQSILFSVDDVHLD